MAGGLMIRSKKTNVAANCAELVKYRDGELSLTGARKAEAILSYYDSDSARVYDCFLCRLWGFNSREAYLEAINSSFRSHIIVQWRNFLPPQSGGLYLPDQTVTVGPLTKNGTEYHAGIAWPTSG